MVELCGNLTIRLIQPRTGPRTMACRSSWHRSVRKAWNWRILKKYKSETLSTGKIQMESAMKRQAILLLAVCSAIAFPALAQRSGQSATVTLGIVQQAEPVTLQSTGAGKGAVVGGALGYASGSSKSKSRRNALIGGAAGAAVSSSGQSAGMQYAVKVSDESVIVVVSDQTQIQIGDCVTVEQVGDSANIRRQDPVACEPKSEQAVAEIQDELIEEANECAALKQQMLEATTQEEIELASTKAKILCNN
jgi:uncharacterized protein YcfJ